MLRGVSLIVQTTLRDGPFLDLRSLFQNRCCTAEGVAPLDSPRKPSSTTRIFYSAEYWRRVSRRITRIDLSALTFFIVSTVPLQGNDLAPLFKQFFWSDFY
jgi:hypothetical protein